MKLDYPFTSGLQGPYGAGDILLHSCDVERQVGVRIQNVFVCVIRIGPYLGKSFQGTPKEFIAGNLGKEWNGKDLNCNPTKDSSVLTLLSSTAMELRELPDNFNTVPLLYACLLGNLTVERDPSMTTVSMIHPLNYICFFIISIYGIILIIFVMKLLLYLTWEITFRFFVLFILTWGYHSVMLIIM